MAALQAELLGRVRGHFERSLMELLWPVTVAIFILSIPVVVIVGRPEWFWPPSYAWNRSAPFLVLFAVLIAAALFVLHIASLTYEFDERYVACRRLGGRILWREALEGLQKLELSSNSHWHRLTLVWSGGRRTIWTTRSLDRALFGRTADT